MHTKTQQAALQKQCEGLPLYKRLLITHRRIIGFIIPAMFVHALWWAFFAKHDLWQLFLTRYPMSITMVFGSLIAGRESLHIPSHIKGDSH